jgi:hypothetical protein
MKVKLFLCLTYTHYVKKSMEEWLYRSIFSWPGYWFEISGQFHGLGSEPFSNLPAFGRPFCSQPLSRILLLILKKNKTKQTPWSESASELYRPSDRRLPAKWLPTFADKGCHAVSVTYPYGRILCFLDRSRYFLSGSSSVVLTRLSGPRTRPTTFFLVPGIESKPIPLTGLGGL